MCEYEDNDVCDASKTDQDIETRQESDDVCVEAETNIDSGPDEDPEANRAKKEAIIADEIKQTEIYASIEEYSKTDIQLLLKLDAKQNESGNAKR
jgi:hypothetical protein